MTALAQELQLRASNYASAFRISARICRTHNGPEELAARYEQKAALEEDLARRLTEDPEGTLREEGLI